MTDPVAHAEPVRRGWLMFLGLVLALHVYEATSGNTTNPALNWAVVAWLGSWIVALR